MKWHRLALSAAFVLLFAAVTSAENTVQDFSADFPPGGGDAPYSVMTGNATFPVEIIEALSGQALQLTQAQNDIQNGASFNQFVSGPYDELVFDFDLQFSLYEPNRGAGADGMGFVYANSARWGVDNNTGAPGFNEEANAAQSFGVGFDIWDNGAQDNNAENSISLHWDGALVESYSLDDAVWDLFNMETEEPLHATISIVPSGTGSNVSVTLVNLDTGDFAVPFENRFIDGMTPYDGRVVFQARTGGANSQQIVDNIQVTQVPEGGGDPFEYLEDFESFDLGPIIQPDEPPLPPLVGGTPFTAYQTGSLPSFRIINETGNPGVQEAYGQLTTTLGSQSNSIAFDKTSDVADDIQATFKIQIDQTPGNAADGMSMLLMDVVAFGDSGALEGGFSEDPNYANTLGIGFDIYDNDEEGNPDYIDVVDPDGCGGGQACLDRRANHVSIHWNNAIVGKAVRIDRAELDLVNSSWNDVTLTATQTDEGMVLTLAIEDGTDGSVTIPFADYLIPGAEFIEGARIAFGGRTGGVNARQLIDDVNVRWTAGDGMRGDYNNNGQLDAEDLDWQAEVSLGLRPFESKYDENNDGVVNELDRGIWLEDLKETWVGDANLDFEFNTADFVQVFTEGKYETGETAGWAPQGDWTGDLIFDTADFVAAFTANGYERGPYPGAGVASVPEPSAIVLSLLGLAGLLGLARRRQG